MPRLEGTHTNPLPVLIAAILIVVVAFFALELAGIIDVIAGLGD
jgi:hypothetical protein